MSSDVNYLISQDLQAYCGINLILKEHTYWFWVWYYSRGGILSFQRGDEINSIPNFPLQPVFNFSITRLINDIFRSNHSLDRAAQGWTLMEPHGSPQARLSLNQRRPVTRSFTKDGSKQRYFYHFFIPLLLKLQTEYWYSLKAPPHWMFSPKRGDLASQSDGNEIQKDPRRRYVYEGQ